MVSVHPQFVIDDKERRQAVLLSVADWQRIVEELEELDDIRAYDRGKAGSQDAIPFEQAVRELENGDIA